MADVKLSPLNWPIRRIMGYTLLVIVIGLALYGAYRMVNIISIVLVAFMAQVAVKPIFEKLKKAGLSPVLAAVMLYAALFLFAVGVVAVTVPLLTSQFSAISARLPEEYAGLRESMLSSKNETLENLANSLPAEFSVLVQKPAETPSTGVTPTPAPTPSAETTPPPADKAAQGVLDFLMGPFFLASTFVLAFYWTLDADNVIAALVMRLPEKNRETTRQLIVDVEQKISAYFGGQLVMCLSIGVAFTIANLVLGLPFAILLGVLAGIFEAVPLLGPTLGMIPAVVVALGTNPALIPGVVISGVLIQQLENNLLVPRIMDKSVGVNPIVSILAITAFAALFGLAGALIAIPLAAVIQILVDRFVINPVMEGPTKRGEVSRSRLGVWRLKAKELAADVRKQSKAKEEKAELIESEDAALTVQVEDLIEKVAREIDQSLAKREVTLMTRATKWWETRQDKG